LTDHQERFPTYLSTEAVTNSADLLHAQGVTDVLDRSLDDGVDVGGLVLGQPSGEIGLAGFHVGDANLVTLEQIRDDGQVAALGELIGEELGVGEDAEDVGEEDNGLLGGLVVLGVGDVGVDYEGEEGAVSSVFLTQAGRDRGEQVLTSVNVLHLANGGTLVLEASSAACGRGVGSHDEGRG
jgi:hypothetical protein